MLQQKQKKLKSSAFGRHLNNMTDRIHNELKKLKKVMKYLREDEINTIIHGLALEHAKENGTTYTRSCMLLVNMLNTIQQELVVANSYTD